MKGRAPYRSKLRDAQAAATRQRILDAVATVLERGEEPTFAAVAEEAGCQERTVYRHFANKDELASEFWRFQSTILGTGDRQASDLGELEQLVDDAFGAFDRRAALVRAMLHTEHGRASRLSGNAAREEARTRLVAQLLPESDERTLRRAAAATHLLFSAAAWELLRDFWHMDAPEAAETVRLALRAMFEGLQQRTPSRQPSPRKR